MMSNSPYRLYSDEVGDNGDSVKYDLYNIWNHIRFRNIRSKTCEKLKNDPLSW